MMLALVLFSSFFIEAAADHDCEGDDCPVCALIHICESFMHRLALTEVQVLLIISVLLSVQAVFIYDDILKYRTPITFKVRMNN